MWARWKEVFSGNIFARIASRSFIIQNVIVKQNKNKYVKCSLTNSQFSVIF